MSNPAGESREGVRRLDFDRRFRGSVVTSDAGLLAYREHDDALGLTTTAGEILAVARTGKNGRHALVADAPQAQLQKELALLKEANARVYAKPPRRVER